MGQLSLLHASTSHWRRKWNQPPVDGRSHAEHAMCSSTVLWVMACGTACPGRTKQKPTAGWRWAHFCLQCALEVKVGPVLAISWITWSSKPCCAHFTVIFEALEMGRRVGPNAAYIKIECLAGPKPLNVLQGLVGIWTRVASLLIQHCNHRITEALLSTKSLLRLRSSDNQGMCPWGITQSCMLP